MFMPARLGPTARLGSPARLRPASRLGLPAGLSLPARPRPLDCDGPCSFGEVIESCSQHLGFGCSCDSPRHCGFLWSFSFCSALRRYLVSYHRIIDHLPFICLDHGVKRGQRWADDAALAARLALKTQARGASRAYCSDGIRKQSIQGSRGCSFVRLLRRLSSLPSLHPSSCPNRHGRQMAWPCSL